MLLTVINKGFIESYAQAFLLQHLNICFPAINKIKIMGFTRRYKFYMPSGGCHLYITLRLRRPVIYSVAPSLRHVKLCINE